jgi:hypothetical protein
MSGPRYPAIPPEQLTAEQRVFHDEMEMKIRNGMGKTYVDRLLESARLDRLGLTGESQGFVTK